MPAQPGLTVRILCLSYAERQESEILVTVTGADKSPLLAPGLVKLTREQSFAAPGEGFIGTWGWQEDPIGDIGMAVITDPKHVVDVVDQPAERRMRCRLTDNGELRYWIIGDWRRGRQYPVAPTVDNWKQEVQALAGELVPSLHVTIGEPEDAHDH